jgi:hypothetical protein
MGMRDGTSGLLFTQKENGAICVMVVDYGVEEFDGRDWESWYDLDKGNADRLSAELKKMHSGTLEQMLKEEFCEGADFSLYKFERYCREHGIAYRHESWV